MSTDQPASSQIKLSPMPQLAEAVDSEDDWTGVTDAATRRRRQNRLNVRAYRRRKALESKVNPISSSASRISITKAEPEIPCWVEDQQTVSILPASVSKTLNGKGSPLMSYEQQNPETFDHKSSKRIIFPLSSDHLIILLQYNVLRGLLANRRLLSCNPTMGIEECVTTALQVLPSPSLPQFIPPSLQPTHLQSTIPYEAWIDIIPHPTWRDNLILATGCFDEDDLWSDTVGGLFEGFPDDEIERRGVVVWDPPWDVSGWEVSEGFWKKWGWSFRGCEDILEVTNRWRVGRGEERLVFEV